MYEYTSIFFHFFTNASLDDSLSKIGFTLNGKNLFPKKGGKKRKMAELLPLKMSH